MPPRSRPRVLPGDGNRPIISVDLPAPLAPISVTTSPTCTDRSMPYSTDRAIVGMHARKLEHHAEIPSSSTSSSPR